MGIYIVPRIQQPAPREHDARVAALETRLMIEQRENDRLANSIHALESENKALVESMSGMRISVEELRAKQVAGNCASASADTQDQAANFTMLPTRLVETPEIRPVQSKLKTVSSLQVDRVFLILFFLPCMCQYIDRYLLPPILHFSKLALAGCWLGVEQSGSASGPRSESACGRRAGHCSG